VVVSRGTTHGTPQGPLGDLPATGKVVRVPWVIFTRFDADRIVEAWELYDEFRFMKQPGLIPESE
jgi:predicted ester cyclase